MGHNVFAVPVFLVVFRETLEAVIIASILLAFLKQTLDGPNGNVKAYKTLRKQVWLGIGIGFFICLVVAGAIIGVFYTVGHDSWTANEYYYEGAFALVASLIISVMGIGLLRVGRMQEKWRVKLAKALEKPTRAPTRSKRIGRWLEKYVMFFLPFITVLREGIEAIVFIAGVSFSAPASAIPLPVVVGLIVGAAVGYVIYKCGATSKVQMFLVVSTCFLYLVAAGLFSRAVWYLESQKWNNIVGGDAAELGTGAGSYDIDKSVWHVNCCSPELNGGGGWGVFNALLGWTNSATYGSVISYNVYWIAVVVAFVVLRFHEANGRLPFGKAKDKGAGATRVASGGSAENDYAPVETKATGAAAATPVSSK